MAWPPAVSSAPEPGALRLVAAYRALGALESAVLAASPRGERLYAVYAYQDGRFDLVAIDPDTGSTEVFPAPSATEWGAVVTAGRDGNLYLGTRPDARIYEFDTRAQRFVDLGHIAAEQYVLAITSAADGNVYATTFPHAKLARVNVAAGTLVDLGSADPSNEYARSVAADDAGTIYVGTGYRHAQIFAYDTSIARRRSLLAASDQLPSQAPMFYHGRDGDIYAVVGTIPRFRLHGTDARRLDEAAFRAAIPPAATSSNYSFELDARDRIFLGLDGTLTRVRRDGPVTRRNRVHINYAGEPLTIWRLGLANDGRIYAGTTVPFRFLRIDAPRNAIADFGIIGAGEPASMLAIGVRLYIGATDSPTQIMAFDYRKPAAVHGTQTTNPELIELLDERKHSILRTDWIAQAMVASQSGDIYIGATDRYVLPGGSLMKYLVKERRLRLFGAIVPQQSVTSLAVAGRFVVGGTSVGPAYPDPLPQARLFVWDSRTEALAGPPVEIPGATQVTDLVTLSGGKVFALASYASDGNHITDCTAILFQPLSRRIVASSALPFCGPVPNSATVGPDGAVWGADRTGIFRASPDTGAAAIVAPAPRPITAGFAATQNTLYVAAGSTVYAYDFVR